MRRHPAAGSLKARALIWVVMLASGGCGLAGCVYALGGIGLIVPGMNQTELQSVMGPPDYIQAKGRRQAWQYCPHFLDRRDDIFVTVWFRDGQVEHMRAYGDRVMGSCEDFLAAFRWEDVIEGEYTGFSK